MKTAQVANVFAEQSEEEEVYSLRHVEPPQSASLVMSNDVMAQLRFPEDQEELTTERRIDVRMTGQNKSGEKNIFIANKWINY